MFSRLVSENYLSSMCPLILFMIISIGTESLLAQTKDPYLVLNNVRDKFSLIDDYEVDIQIKVDVNFIKVPESEARLYFKQPDKVKLDSDGFALLPRQGLDFSPSKIISGDFTAIYSKTDTLEKRSMDVIKILPSIDSADVILTTLWIDSELLIIRKIETSTKSSGTFKVDLKYEKTLKIGLPSSVIFTFNLSKIRLPMRLPGDRRPEEQPNQQTGGDIEGKVTVLYSNYKINQGLPDSFFENAN